MILGIESSGTTGGAALLDGDHLMASVCFTSSTLYSQRLMPSIDWLFERAGLDVSALTGVAVSRGPGSFTGLRIGMSVAKGFAYANSIPIVGVSTLEAIALRAAGVGPVDRVCALLDARQGEVYAAMYRVAGRAPDSISALMPALEPLHDEFAGSLDAVLEWITETTLFAGEGAFRCRERLAEALGGRFLLAPSIRNLPSAEEVAWLGARCLASGPGDDLVALEPRYLRRSYTEKSKPKRGGA
jgi:tRNA threonylcarbamoyladenosine biosynthesis protein TsaB